MLKRFSHFFSLLLLVLLPLQSVAAANMIACNSLMQAKTQQQTATMPLCDMHMADTTKNASDTQTQNKACKERCANLCAQLSTALALPNILKVASLQVASEKLQQAQLSYASVTLASLQRPPIHLS